MRIQFFIAAIFLLATGVSYAEPAATASPPGNMGRFIVYRPKIEYPFEARKRRIEGAGVFVVRIHIPSGRVTQAVVGKSTGAFILDDAAKAKLMEFRFKPGAVPYYHVEHTPWQLGRPPTKDEVFVKIPVNFNLIRGGAWGI